MKPISQVDIWNILHPFIGECPPAATHVTLSFGGESHIMVLADEPKNVTLNKVQTERLWRKLAHVMNLPAQGVKKATFELRGAGIETPMVHIDMKPISKPTLKTRKLRMLKQDGESIEVLGEQVILHDVKDMGLIVVSMDADEQLQQHLDAFSKAIAERSDNAIVIALPRETDLATYTFEEVVEQ